MKNKRFLLCLLFPLLLLTSCEPTYEKFYIPYNLDIIVEEQESYSPTSLSPYELRTMIQTKQSFGLYYYSLNCGGCKNSSELLDEYLSKNKIQMYKISSTDVYYFRGEENPLEPFMFLFEATPNIYFFNQGNLTATLPRNKYSSGFNVFQSTLNNIMVNSYIFNTTKLLGLEKFLENNQEYLIYISSYSDNSENSYDSLSQKTFSDVVYPSMSTSEYSTLNINIDKAEESLVSFLETTFHIEDVKANPHLALYKYRTGITNNEFETGVIYYNNEEGVNSLDQLITNHLLKRDYTI